MTLTKTERYVLARIVTEETPMSELFRRGQQNAARALIKKGYALSYKDQGIRIIRASTAGLNYKIKLKDIDNWVF